MAQLEYDYTCEINKNKWDIYFVSHEELLKLFDDKDTVQAYGLCKYTFHTIYINTDLCDHEIKNALRHELMHAYVWSFGLCEHEAFTEEDLCNLYSASVDIIEPIVKNIINY